MKSPTSKPQFLDKIFSTFDIKDEFGTPLSVARMCKVSNFFVIFCGFIQYLGKIVTLHLHFLRYWQISIIVNGQIRKNKLGIWSHRIHVCALHLWLIWAEFFKNMKYFSSKIWFGPKLVNMTNTWKWFETGFESWIISPQLNCICDWLL